MGKTLLAFIVLSMLAVSAGYASSGFSPVQVRTKPLTMTGVKQEPVAEQPRDFQFNPVSIRTRPLIMTGMRD